MELKGEFKLADLAFLTFSTSADRDGDPDGYEDVISASGAELYASDTDQGSAACNRDGWGWTCLVLRSEVPAWTEAATAAGYNAEVEDATASQHYGDGHWEGVDLVCRPGSETDVYWIER